MHKRAIADDEPEMEATIDDKVEFLRVQYSKKQRYFCSFWKLQNIPNIGISLYL